MQAYYAESAQRLGRVYESVSFESVHEALLDLLAQAPARALTLRRGEPPVDRRMFDVAPEEVAGHGAGAGLTLLRIVDEKADRLGRDAVHWNAVALQLG
ncbi:MAG: hypothetical protein JF598_12230 [Streptomyces sp.]|nr:hypothetical protein [Streptomyces sp.]